MAYDPTTPAGQVRLLINDMSNDPVFTDPDINGFLAMEGQNVKRAAAQALDVIADDEALTSKAISTQAGVSTNGPAVAASLRARAKTLRDQAIYDLTLDDDGGLFDIVDMTDPCDTRYLV